MIDSKAFIEFFEKEYGIEFIDSATGKRALDIVREKEADKAKTANKDCSSCKWGSMGDGKKLHTTDMVCVNAESKFIAEFVTGNHTCKQWESER